MCGWARAARSRGGERRFSVAAGTVLREEFFQKYYGPAGEPMRNYWLTAEKHFALARMGFDYGRIRAEYDLNYGRRGGRGGRGDHAAALRFFQANQARLEALQGHHPADGPYWPALVPNYFVVDLAKVRSRLEAAVKSASTQPVGELDE